jgi:hypothetical protein
MRCASAKSSEPVQIFDAKLSIGGAQLRVALRRRHQASTP